MKIYRCKPFLKIGDNIYIDGEAYVCTSLEYNLTEPIKIDVLKLDVEALFGNLKYLEGSNNVKLPKDCKKILLTWNEYGKFNNFEEIEIKEAK